MSVSPHDRSLNASYMHCVQGAPAESSKTRCAAVQLALVRWIKTSAFEFAQSLRRALAVTPTPFVPARAMIAAQGEAVGYQNPLASPSSALHAFPPRALVRTLVTRAEVDAGRVRHHFEATSGKSLAHAIQVMPVFYNN